jgi:hypothetical protein
MRRVSLPVRPPKRYDAVGWAQPASYRRAGSASRRCPDMPNGAAPRPRSDELWALTQWNESPQAQEFCALGLSIVKPWASMRSAKSIVAPVR